MDDPICQKLKKELEGKPKVRISIAASVQCCSAAVFLCQGLNVVTVGETYHYCYPEVNDDDERYR